MAISQVNTNWYNYSRVSEFIRYCKKRLYPRLDARKLIEKRITTHLPEEPYYFP